MEYTKTEFRKACVQSGYASSKTVTEFFKQYPKEVYTDKDFIEAYRFEGHYSKISKKPKIRG